MKHFIAATLRALEWPAVLLAALVLAFSLIFLQTGKVWGSEIEIGNGVLCDEAAQMKRFIELNTGDHQAALDQVNAENNPTSCVPATVAFIRGSPMATEKNWIITSILVVAVATPQGWQRINPHVYYSAFKDTTVPDRGA